MKVKTMIERLSKFNPDAEVRLNEYYGETALFINARVDNKNVVWVDGEYDIDLGEEISARYEAVNSGIISELKLYTQLLEDGITADMVGKYMGESYAEYMKDFCEEHDLM